MLTQHIEFSTHTSGTQPDILLASQPELVLEVEDACKLGNSDHTMIMSTIAGSISTNVTFEEVPDWRRADLDGLRRELGGIVWENRLNDMDTETTWETIKDIMYECESKCVPKKRRRAANRPL
jgi:hypothetical protein